MVTNFVEKITLFDVVFLDENKYCSLESNVTGLAEEMALHGKCRQQKFLMRFLDVY